MYIWLRRLFLIVIPLILVVIETQHSKGFSDHVFDGLNPHASFWKWLHVAQSFLFAGAALGIYFLTRDINNIWAILSRFFLFLFVVTYLVFDATAGIAVGSILEHSHHDASLDIGTVKSVVQSLFNDPIVGGTLSVFSITGSVSWLLAIFAAIIALYHKYQAWPHWKVLPPLILLTLSGFFLFVGHYPPFGPLAFSALALAAIWFEYYQFQIGVYLY